jgi:hypothetical protein
MNAPYSGTLGIVRGNHSAGWLQIDRKVFARRCTGCHAKRTWANRDAPPEQTTDIFNTGGHPYLVDPHKPELSVLLRAPLAKEAGGLGTCRKDEKDPPFASTDDPDHQAMLAAVRKWADAYAKNPPPEQVERVDGSYLREMDRLGLYEKGLEEAPFALDEKYYESCYRQYLLPSVWDEAK